MQKLFGFILCIGFYSMSIGQSITPTSRLTSEVLNDVSQQVAINNYVSSHQSMLNNLTFENRIINFNFQDLKVLKTDDVLTSVVSCTEMTNTSSLNAADQQPMNGFSLSFIFENGLVKTHMFSRVNTTDGKKDLEIFNNEFNSLYTLKYDTLSESISMMESPTGVQSRNSGCGQATLNCISHHYTKDGWYSIGLWIGTLVQPSVGIVVAAACGATCCLNIGCPGN